MNVIRSSNSLFNDYVYMSGSKTIELLANTQVKNNSYSIPDNVYDGAKCVIPIGIIFDNQYTDGHIRNVRLSGEGAAIDFSYHMTKEMGDTASTNVTIQYLVLY